jgi:hypothetical protein
MAEISRQTMRRITYRWLVALTLFSAGLLFTENLGAQEFRIETEVTNLDTNETVSENLTLFDENIIVDFMLKPDKTRFPVEIVAYVVNEKRFVLMDTMRKVKTELVESELLKILAALQGSAFVNDDNRFLFQPEFEESIDPSTGWLELRSPQLIYRMRGQRPENELALHKYFEFIDQFARLNATDPRRMPPFARLKLNQSIKKQGVIPEQVEMTLVPDKLGNEPEIRMCSKHVVMWELSETDRQRIESAKRYWMEFENIGLKRYRGLDAETAMGGNVETVPDR